LPGAPFLSGFRDQRAAIGIISEAGIDKRQDGLSLTAHCRLAI
jgi:hypothetical protein